MPLAQQIKFISEAEYLTGEKLSEIKHEYIDGEVYAMAGRVPVIIALHSMWQLHLVFISKANLANPILPI